jgi:hypothetical protein
MPPATTASQRPGRLFVDATSPSPMWPEKSIDDSSRTRRPAQSYSRSTTVE